MDTSKLKRFAQHARRQLLDQVKAKLDLVLAQDSAARRENSSAVKELEQQIAQTGKAQVIDKVAYTWFNRFCALRFMDLNGYSKIRVVSPADESQFLPEVLAEAKQGHMDEDRVPEKTRQRVDALLSGKAPSHDPQQEAYRLLVVAECNAFHQAMPYLFERIADYTELLMPEDLLSGNSVLAYTREAMTPDACQDVEVIGWLYQFYISEKKDQVFDGLKKNQKITPENIPAATQLFTPHWIVRYLVENSLGRLWMLNHPGSPLAGQMDYYIAPEKPETDFLKIAKPEDIKVCDPACGSGHMLTYAFDLLYAMYEEVGTDPSEIPEKILTHNLFGIEIDERAGELAAFALTMKARAKSRRFFNKGIKPNICVLQKVTFETDELSEYMNAVGRDLFTLDLRETLQQFADVGNLGSLITPKLASVANVLPVLQAKDMAGNLFLANTHAKVVQVLQMADYLTPRYAVVVANPPYMGSNGMNERLGTWLKNNLEDFKSDLFSAFVVRTAELGKPSAHFGIMSPNVWMYISSHRKLRNFVLSHNLLSLIELPLTGFKGATVQICAYIFSKNKSLDNIGKFIRLVDFKGADAELSRITKGAILNKDEIIIYSRKTKDFLKIPGSPIAYWIGQGLIESFSKFNALSNFATPRKGMVTADNPRFIRLWHEVSKSKIGFGLTSREQAKNSGKKYFPYMKGGIFRRWSGNMEAVVNWENDGQELLTMKGQGYKVGSTNHNLEYIFKPAITWTKITSSDSGFRSNGHGYLYDDASGLCPVMDFSNHYKILGLLNSPVTTYILRALNPTLNLNPGNLSDIPVPQLGDEIAFLSKRCEEISNLDWNTSENSWDFKAHQFVINRNEEFALKDIYQEIQNFWRGLTLEMKNLETKINESLVEAYDLKGEIRHEVDISEITLINNPNYRYGSDKSGEELEALLLTDTTRELISYAVGCMFGRYSIDKLGLVLANTGETLADYLTKVPQTTFSADEDNVIPMLDGEWFVDDVTERFRQFLRVTFGDAHYDENLAFIEQALNAKGKRNYTLRDYMLGEFYADHVKRYKKRPIYWLFSSPKGTFNALIYLHRYRPDTASVVLRYLRDFRAKLAARQSTLEQVLINPTTSQGEKTRANKEIDTLKKQIIELQDYENDTLYPLAAAQVAIDLDDGVKVNYLKLGAALKKIRARDAKEED